MAPSEALAKEGRQSEKPNRVSCGTPDDTADGLGHSWLPGWRFVAQLVAMAPTRPEPFVLRPENLVAPRRVRSALLVDRAIRLVPALGDDP